MATRDGITDFTQGSATIDLSDIDALTTTGGDDAFTLLGTAADTGAGATLGCVQGAATRWYSAMSMPTAVVTLRSRSMAW